MDLSDPRIGEAYRLLTSNRIGWFILASSANYTPGLGPGSSGRFGVITMDKHVEEGHDSLHALRSRLDQMGEVCHVVVGPETICHAGTGTGQQKLRGQVLVTYLPKQHVFGVRRAQAITQARALGGLFQGVCSTVQVSSLAELDPADLEYVLRQGQISRKASGGRFRKPSGPLPTLASSRQLSDGARSVSSGQGHSKHASLSSTLPLGQEIQHSRSRQYELDSSSAQPSTRPVRKASLRAMEHTREARSAATAPPREPSADHRSDIEDLYDEPRPVSRLPNDIYDGYDDTQATLRTLSAQPNMSDMQGSMQALALHQPHSRDMSLAPSRGPMPSTAVNRSQMVESDEDSVVYGREQDAAKRSSSVLFRRRTTRRPEQMASMTDVPPTPPADEMKARMLQLEENDRAVNIRREMQRRQLELEDERRRREEEEERLRGIVRRKEELRMAEENEIRRQAEILEAQRLESTRREQRRAEQEAEARRREEQTRIASERLRLEEEHRLQEARRREAKEATLMKVLMSGQSLNSGQINVQHGTSAVWRIRNYELTTTALALYKDAQAPKPICVLQLADLRTITDHPEEVSIANGFKLGFTASETEGLTMAGGEEEEDEYLFFCATELEKDQLIDNLQNAAEAIEAAEEEQQRLEEERAARRQPTQPLEPVSNHMDEQRPTGALAEPFEPQAGPRSQMVHPSLPQAPAESSGGLEDEMLHQYQQGMNGDSSELQNDLYPREEPSTMNHEKRPMVLDEASHHVDNVGSFHSDPQASAMPEEVSEPRQQSPVAMSPMQQLLRTRNSITQKPKMDLT